MKTKAALIALSLFAAAAAATEVPAEFENAQLRLRTHAAGAHNVMAMSNEGKAFMIVCNYDSVSGIPMSPSADFVFPTTSGLLTVDDNYYKHSGGKNFSGPRSPWAQM